MDTTEHLYGWTWLGNYNPISAGWQDCVPGHKFGPAVREFRVIHYILSGKGILRIRNKEYHLKEGQLFSIPPMEPAYYEADAEDPWSYVWIDFVNNQTAPYFFDDIVISAPSLRSDFLDIKNYSDHENTGKLHVANVLNDIAEKLTSQKSNDAALVQNAVRYIHQHYVSTGLSVAEIADKFNVSRYVLRSAFTNETGLSPVQYIIQHRLKMACRYMVESNIPPSAVFYSVGYASYSHFAKIFRKHIGISPSDYKKQSLKQGKHLQDIENEQIMFFDSDG